MLCLDQDSVCDQRDECTCGWPKGMNVPVAGPRG